ncbi:MAG: S-layer homology domain-containing protein [bacterium]|nr:S-layer homology domain-containing protein [bacterium]
MAQKIGTFLVLILMLSLMHPVHALGDEISVLQGNHFVIVLHDENIVSATAQFHEKSWPFFRIKGAPRPDEAITRGEFIGLLYQSRSLDDLPMENPVEFGDLHPSHHFYAEILDASAKGIISGYTNGNFGPYDPLTR